MSSHILAGKDLPVNDYDDFKIENCRDLDFLKALESELDPIVQEDMTRVDRLREEHDHAFKMYYRDLSDTFFENKYLSKKREYDEMCKKFIDDWSDLARIRSRIRYLTERKLSRVTNWISSFEDIGLSFGKGLDNE